MEMLFLTKHLMHHFQTKLRSVLYNAITGAIKGSSRDKLYQELSLEYLQQRKWMRRLCLPYKFLSTGQPSYVHNLLPQMRTPTVSFLAELNISKTPHVIKME